jgi:hypothetical protein
MGNESERQTVLFTVSREVAQAAIAQAIDFSLLAALWADD